MIKIDKDIPTPPLFADHSKWPFRQMEVGDSFFVPTGSDAHSAASAMSNANYKYKPKKWTKRTLNGGIRIWRIQ